jgi:class 3 adenylate cyclase
VPKALVRRLVRRADGSDFPSVERELTIFFSDIAGYTAMSQRLNATESARLLNRHIALVTSAIDATGGTVDKFIGDAVMAFWGAPKRQEDHAERALRASLAAAQAVIRDNAERRAAGLPPLRVRIGLHTGRVVVGNIGAPGRVNYTIIGDAVNISERLQELGKQLGREGDDVTILLSRSTADRLPPGLPIEPAGSFSLRGRAGAVEVFRAILPAADATPAPARRAAAP